MVCRPKIALRQMVNARYWLRTRLGIWKILVLLCSLPLTACKLFPLAKSFQDSALNGNKTKPLLVSLHPGNGRSLSMGHLLPPAWGFAHTDGKFPNDKRL
ncbi:hypothetical protein Y1Q_0023071 [Alligator mississippiensis]|uniref:Uncharacterized protein n=1 Tax=Alligator mississippiensis TaxID=8496 RepID=A0A151NJS4_ALLMI|nr:hypothetical protein Y1Q_0023071 [Alligator mississippiensis]